ncbi:protein ZBED8 [Trichonephila clavipes]|nr:protein ZBED8 [Trichonephila clavipes]
MGRMFASTSQRDNGLQASYNISLLIAKSEKSHTIGEELILPVVENVLKTITLKSASDIIKRIPLSNNTAQRRIAEMNLDIESFLCDYLQTTHFSLQLDESTLPGNESLLLACVRFIMDQEHHEEMFFARTSTTDSKGESIFNVLKENFIENSITLSNIISLATDGAPTMVGRCRGFIGHSNQNGDIEETDIVLQEELIGISTNEELKVQFKNGYQKFWLQKVIPLTYPILYNIATKLSIAFPSSYLVEIGLSAVANFLTKKKKEKKGIGHY